MWPAKSSSFKTGTSGRQKIEKDLIGTVVIVLDQEIIFVFVISYFRTSPFMCLTILTIGRYRQTMWKILDGDTNIEKILWQMSHYASTVQWLP